MDELSKRSRTKYIGVYQRQAGDGRINHRDGKADVCFEITYKNKARKKVWEKIGWRSEGFTAQFASNLRAERMQLVRLGQPVKPQEERVMTLAEAWAIYEEKHIPTIKRGNDEKALYNRHIASKFADIPLDQITTLELESYKQELLKKKVAPKQKDAKSKLLSPATVRHVLGLLGRIYNKMNTWGLYDGKSPVAAVKKPKLDNARVRFLSREQAQELLNILKQRSHIWWALAFISLNTGLRLSEILGLRTSDINLDARTIHVRDAKAGTRIAVMTDEARDFFAENMPTGKNKYLFTNTDGKPYSSTTVSKLFVRMVNEMGLNDDVSDARQKVVFHTLRHTFASWLAMEGVPLYTIAELMGHSTLEMTKRYAHLCPDTKLAAINSISNMLHR